MWADVEAILAAWLTAQLGDDVRAVLTLRPPNLRTQMPIVVVSRFGGGDDTPTLDAANVDIDTYAATQAGGKAISGRIHALMRGQFRNHTAAGGHVVTRARTLTGPLRRPYDAKHQVHRYGGAYTVWVHTRTSA